MVGGRRGSRQGCLVVVAALFAVLMQVSLAFAHNAFSTLDVQVPAFSAGHWTFNTRPYGVGCINGGDATTCAQGFDFIAHSGAQINPLGDWQAFGQVAKSVVRHYPNSTAVTASFGFDCPSGNPTYTVQTRGKGGIKHNRLWTFTDFFFSPSRTRTC